MKKHIIYCSARKHNLLYFAVIMILVCNNTTLLAQQSQAPPIKLIKVRASGTNKATAETASKEIQTIINSSSDIKNLQGTTVDRNGEIILTPNDTWELGAIWSQDYINLENDFELSADLYFGTDANRGADGIAFVLQADCNGAGAFGMGLGYQDINPSLVIEFDSHHNSGLKDPVQDHVGIQKNGNPSHKDADNGKIAAPVDVGELEDGEFHPVTISWVAATKHLQLDMIVNGQSRKIYNQEIALDDIFGVGNRLAFWGFTASTGDWKNKHSIKITSIKQTEITPYSIKPLSVAGAADGAIEMTLPGNNLTYTWSANVETNQKKLNGKEIERLKAGTYTVTVTKTGSSCKSHFEIVLEADPCTNPVSISPWEIHRGQGYVPFQHSYRGWGNPGLYEKIKIPGKTEVINAPLKRNDLAQNRTWELAPTDDLGRLNVDWTNSEVERYTEVDYTYYRRFIYAPLTANVGELTLTIGKVDDGARVYIFNEDFPEGYYDEAKQAKLGGSLVTVDFTDQFRKGQLNTLVIVQVDESKSWNKLTGGAVIKIEGNEVQACTDWDNKHPEFVRQENYAPESAYSSWQVEQKQACLELGNGKSIQSPYQLNYLQTAISIPEDAIEVEVQLKEKNRDSKIYVFNTGFCAEGCLIPDYGDLNYDLSSAVKRGDLNEILIIPNKPCEKGSCLPTATVIIDNKAKTIKLPKLKTAQFIGKTWTMENLYMNIQGSSCYEDQSINCDNYGRLYTWDAAKQACELLDGGAWRLPSIEEWTNLRDELKSKPDAKKEFTLSFEPGGMWDYRYKEIKTQAHYWSSSEKGDGQKKTVNFNNASLNTGGNLSKNYLLSVRCVKD